MADYILIGGGKFDDRTAAMYREVERLTPFDIFVSQGGFNVGGVSASAGTHDRAAVDVSGSILTAGERWAVVTNMRRVGFAAWIRTPAQGFSYHVHGVPINGDLSTAARAQVVQYKDKRNGLAGAGPDDGPAGYYDMTWEKYTGSSAYRPPFDTGSTDWLDMASEADVRKWIAEEVTKALRQEGVSGAAVMDPGQYPNGTYTVGSKVQKIAAEEATKALRNEGVSGVRDIVSAIAKKLGV